MALPTILVNSVTGSDTQASGAGPTTALFGTTDASTDGAGTTVTLTAGTDTTGVATDGSHVIFLNDATAGARNFGKITGKAGSGGATPTVTVSDAFGLTLTNKSWAIGGKRASIGTTTSKKLFDNNSGSGDAMPGWIVELQSAHSETIAATFDLRRGGDTTTGPIILRGESGAGTLPVLTFSNNGNALVFRNSYIVARDFELRNSNATKTASIALSSGSNAMNFWSGLKIAHATNKFWKGMSTGATDNMISGCEVANTASDGITLTTSATRHSLFYNFIHECGGIGVSNTGNGITIFYGNIVENCTGDGLKFSGATAASVVATIMHNTFDGNNGDGIEFTGTAADGQLLNLKIINNIFTDNIGYGLNFSVATDVSITANQAFIAGNDYSSNTSGATNPSTISVELGKQTLDPQFTSPGVVGSNYAIGTNLRAKGYPRGDSTHISYSNTLSFVDPGAAQRDETAQFGYLPVAP